MSLVAAINSAQSKSPLDGFLLCDLIEVNGGNSYYGYQATSQAWIIKLYNDTTGSLRYCAGTTDYSTAWANRASLTYALPAEA